MGQKAEIWVWLFFLECYLIRSSNFALMCHGHFCEKIGSNWRKNISNLQWSQRSQKWVFGDKFSWFWLIFLGKWSELLKVKICWEGQKHFVLFSTEIWHYQVVLSKLSGKKLQLSRKNSKWPSQKNRTLMQSWIILKRNILTIFFRPKFLIARTLDLFKKLLHMFMEPTKILLGPANIIRNLTSFFQVCL